MPISIGTGLSAGGSSVVTLGNAFPAANQSLNMSALSQALLASGYSHTRGKKSAVLAGTGPLKIVLFGDSTTMGSNAFGAGNSINLARAGSPTPALAQYLNRNGLPAFADNWISDNTLGNYSAQLLTAYDARVTVSSASWTYSTGALTLGGSCYKNSTDTTATLSFLPFGMVDTCDVYYVNITGGGSFTVARSGDTTSPAQNTSSGTNNTIGKYTFQGALGNTNPFVIQNTVLGNGCYIIGMDCYQRNTPSVRIYNAGANGTVVHAWANSSLPYSPIGMLEALAPDLCILQPGINDAAAGTTIGNASTPGTYIGDLQLLVTAAQLSGDVIIDTHYPSPSASTNWNTQVNYVNALISWANGIGIAVNDIFNKWGTQENMVALTGGLVSTTTAAQPNGFYANALHPTTLGYQSRAQADAAIILAI